ncbi:MAG TPA: CopD family protein [Geminicoccaceae bacterium]|nr:CopD family protein [Geminicoccaceae bacterium]
MAIGLIVHVLAAVIWVGGMFFAYMVLRQAVGPIDPHPRLELWRRVLRQFFPWVWLSIVALLVSGYGMMFLALGGFAGAGVHVHIMQATGLLMIALFLHLYFAPWRRLQRALDQSDDQAAAGQLSQIRWIVATNLVLGLITTAIGASGRYWG